MQNDTITDSRRLVLAGSTSLTNPIPPAMARGLTSPAALGLTLTTAQGLEAASNVTRPIPRTMDPLVMVSSLSFNTTLPLLGVGLVTLVLSLCFCCYLWKLKRDGNTERGYSQLKFHPRSKKVKNDMCPVCLEEFGQDEKVAVSRCHHGFHTKCLQQWLNQHNTCPMCKSQVGIAGQAGERTGLITSNV